MIYDVQNCMIILNIVRLVFYLSWCYCQHHSYVMSVPFGVQDIRSAFMYKMERYMIIQIEWSNTLMDFVL